MKFQLYLHRFLLIQTLPGAMECLNPYPINAGTAVHLGGGGNLSQPDPVLMREAVITNAVMTAREVTAMKANIVAFYPALKFQ